MRPAVPCLSRLLRALYFNYKRKLVRLPGVSLKLNIPATFREMKGLNLAHFSQRHATIYITNVNTAKLGGGGRQLFGRSTDIFEHFVIVFYFPNVTNLMALYTTSHVDNANKITGVGD
jgi:hypothetical protein